MRDWLSRTIDRFMPDAVIAGSPEDRRRARLAIGLALVLAPVMGLLAITQLLWHNPEGGGGSLAIAGMLTVAPFAYRRWGRMSPIVHTMLGFGCSALLYIAISSRGPGVNAASIGLTELPLFALLLTGLAGGVAWAVISCAAGLVLALLGYEGLLVERVPADSQLFVEHAALMLITLTLFALGVLYETHRTATMRETADQERALREAEKRQVEAESETKLAHAEKLASIGRVTAAVAHEVNNPLSYLGMNLRYVREELSRGDHDRAEIDQALADCIDGVSRISHLVGRLRTYARGDAGAADVGSADLRIAIDRALKLTEPQTRGRASVRSEVPQLPLAGCPEQNLVQVLGNLIVNAAQAVPAGSDSGEIEIRARRDGELLVVEVCDNGCGIPDDVLPRITEPFFTTKPIGEGTGLGLAVSKSILRTVGGKLEFESAPGRTIARARLPIAHNVQTHLAAAPIARSPALGGAPDGLRILIVDDDEKVARSLERILASHDITSVGSGARALEVLDASARYDLILCDLMMPGMTGMDVYDAVLESRPEVADRMVFLTGGAFTDAAQEFCERHSANIVAKPVSLDKLEQILIKAAAAHAK